MAQEARDLIERIGSEHSIEPHGKVASILTNALELLSQELYDVNTHFLLELLQNADDNTYDANVTPTWTIHYQPGSLRVDCNETGFTARNVEAICEIGGSTKRSRNSVDGFTGEKGIGFKSVFQATDVVWISSNAYSFKFDKREGLGMICPSWETFPRDTSPKSTSMLFQLGSNYNEELLEKQLREFDSRQLMFLRRIRRIQLSVEQKAEPTLNRDLQRVDYSKHGHTVTELEMGCEKATFVVVRHQIRQLPNERRRQNCTGSELALAFPISDSSAVVECGTQNVYATLPIRDYGLKFLLHGDFILTASRQQIDTSLAWNKALRDSVADAFLAAVDNLNKGPMKAIWPYFVPGSETSPFFKPSRFKIIEKLSYRKVLLTLSNKMAIPSSSLFYVDLTKFGDSEGIPFTLAEYTKGHYLSPVYGPWIVAALSSTGLRELSATDFLEHLGSIISRDQEAFCSRPLWWHSELAAALTRIQTDLSCKNKIKGLPLIPICTGEWVSASSEPVFIDEKFSAFPTDIETLAVIDPIAANDADRATLFSMLGIQTCQISDLCKCIIDAHASSEFNPQKYLPAALISHAKFLLENCRQPKHKIDIWFATSTGLLRCRGSSLYIRGDFPPDSPESRVFEQISREFSVIHDDYLAEFNTQEARDYLQDFLQVLSIPRLVEYESASNFHLSNEFKALFQVCRASDILQVLCKHWQFYCKWIEQDSQKSESESRSRLSLVKDIGEMAVKTSDGFSMLRETMLSGLDPNVEGEVSLPTLDLDIHDGFAREGLKRVGITVEADIHYYLSCLRHLQYEDSPRKEVVSYLYEKIQHQCNGHEELVMDFFKRNNCVYVNPAEPSGTERAGWTTIEECAKRKVNLEAQYPTCRRLFGDVVGPERSKISYLLASTESINSATELIDILHIFTGISRRIEAMDPLEAIRVVKPLMKKSIMPVRKLESTLPYDLVTPQDSDWFIADQMYLQVSFCNKVPLLAFSVDEMLGIDKLLQSLDLERRKLSKCVQELSSPKEPFRHCKEFERILRDRAVFIEELIPSSNVRRLTLIRHLKSISVSTAAAILLEYILEHGNTKLHGRPNNSKVSSSFNNKEMKFYLANEDYPSSQTIFDIGDEIAKHCGIEDTKHLRLLYETLITSDTQDLQTRFAKQGIHVSVPVQDTLSKAQRARAGDVLPFPYPFSHDDDYLGDELNVAGVRTKRHKRRDNRSEGEKRESDSDRRLPVLNLVHVHFKLPGVYYMGGNLDPDKSLEFIGQHMASQFLEAYLGTTYNPDRHWTSELRMRAGLTRPETCHSRAAFTMAGSRTSNEVIDFLYRCGFDGVMRWRGILQTAHFEVVTSESATGSPFVCSWSQIQRFRRYKLNDCPDQCPRDIVILLRVRNVYQRPQFEISINPWELFCSEDWLIQGDGYFSVSMGGRPTDPVPSRSDSQTATSFSGISVRSPPTTVEYAPGLANRPKMRAKLPKSLTIGSTELVIPSTRSSQNVAAVMGMQEWTSHDYVYKHLDDGSFRVFILFPGSQGDVLRGEICTMPLTSDRRYRTLSYVWGIENQPTHTILTPDGILTVKPSLNDALLTIRQKSSRVHLWIDAICIDQNDAEEKARQIRLLPRIFQNASCTVAFLGADKTSNDAITTLMQINAKSVCGSDVEDWPKNLPRPPSSWEGRFMPGPESQVWTDVMALFRRPWFRRAWIIQEAVAAPTVTMVCGGLAFDWNNLFEAMKLVDYGLKISGADTVSWGPFMVLGWHREREARQNRYPLAQLLDRYRHVQSTLARDRFFALLGLASDGNNPEYTPDYNATFEDIVVKIARAFVAQGRGMSLLNAAGLGSQHDRFPSWIPDWTVTTAGSLGDSPSLGVSFNASSNLKEDIHCGEEPNVLVVKGHLVDAITKINESPNDTQNQRGYFSDLESIVYFGLLEGIVEGWTFVTTEKGLRGMVPGTAKVGDSVCILNGGNVPFLLRRGVMHTDSYQLVGQCHITGIMHGEALASQKSFPQVFRLY